MVVGETTVKESVKKAIEDNLNDQDKGQELDLSNEELSIEDYEFLEKEIINKSSLLKKLKLPKLSKNNCETVLALFDRATTTNSTLTQIDFNLSDDVTGINTSYYLERIHSRLKRNMESIFFIHGGGPIGMGVMGPVVSGSPFGYHLIATSGDAFFNILINNTKQFGLSHETSRTPVKGVKMINRNKPGDVISLYEQANIAAICLKPNALENVAAERIARGLIQRYDKDGSGLTIFVLMNKPMCDKFVQEKVAAQLQSLTKNPDKVAAILKVVKFVRTVVDRIVTKIDEATVKKQLENQSLDRSYDFLKPNTPFDQNVHSQELIQLLATTPNVEVDLFDAESSFKLYAPNIPEVRRFPAIKAVDDIEVPDAIKNRLINGAHVAFAWLGVLKGYRTVAESINDLDIFQFVEEMMDQEVIPTLKTKFPNVTSNELKEAKDEFFQRVRANKIDLNGRVGCDPMRKLLQGGRIRGPIMDARDVAEKNRESQTNIEKLLTIFAAGIFYAFTDTDPENPGCQKIREIYEANNKSYEAVLCYKGPYPGGYYEGFNPANDKDLIDIILNKIALIEKEYKQYKELSSCTESTLTEASVQTKLKLTTLHQAGSPQVAKYAFWKPEINHLQDKLKELGILLDPATGHVLYQADFQPLDLNNAEVVFVRHGETYGNCGQSTAEGKIDNNLVSLGIKDKEHKRIFQGNVDEEINQLTEHGKKQAQEVAVKLKKDLLDKEWIPYKILVSPLTRAKDTALPFVQQNKFEDRYVECKQITEMAFGTVDNRRICDIPLEDPCHSFYLNQDALVKNPQGENFCEVLLRANSFLQELKANYAGKRILIFSHSMFGAACCILLGKGQKIENDNYLAFDGANYTMPNATPFPLNFKISENISSKFIL